MNDMKTKFDAKELTDNPSGYHGDTEIERGDKSQFKVLAVLAEYKNAGCNMTEEQNTFRNWLWARRVVILNLVFVVLSHLFFSRSA